MLELKVAAVQSFALLINKFREGAQAGWGAMAGPGQERSVRAGERIKY